MIYKPNRREFLRYSGAGLAAATIARKSGAQIPGIGSVAPSTVISPIIASSSAAGNGNITTTPAINTTGASMLLVGMVSNGSLPATDFTDTMSNTFSSLRGNAGVPGVDCTFYITVGAPATSASHTVSFTNGPGAFESIFFVAFTNAILNFSGSYSASPSYSIYDAVLGSDANLYVSLTNGNNNNNPVPTPAPNWSLDQNGAGSTSTGSQQGGSITPIANNSLVVSMVGTYNGGSATPTLSVDSGMTILQSTSASGTNYGGAIAYLLQGSAAAINPTWTMAAGAGNPGYMVVQNAAFKD